MGVGVYVRGCVCVTVYLYVCSSVFACKPKGSKSVSLHLCRILSM